MNRSEFITKLSQELESTKVDAAKNLDTVLKCIADSLKDHDEVKFIGFGTFKGKFTKAREVTTPKGYIAKVPAGKRISFSAGAELKKIVNNVL